MGKQLADLERRSMLNPEAEPVAMGVIINDWTYE
jgi:hypothetical protein